MVTRLSGFGLPRVLKAMGPSHGPLDIPDPPGCREVLDNAEADHSRERGAT